MIMLLCTVLIVLLSPKLQNVVGELNFTKTCVLIQRRREKI